MSLEKSEYWLNKTKSGKGLIIWINDKAHVCSVNDMLRLIEDEIKGVNLSVSTSEEQLTLQK